MFKEKSVEPIKIGDIVSFLNFSGNGEIVGLSSIKKADEYYRKNFGMSIFETFDPPTKNTPVYLIKFAGEGKQPVPENEILTKIDDFKVKELSGKHKVPRELKKFLLKLN